VPFRFTIRFLFALTAAVAVVLAGCEYAGFSGFYISVQIVLAGVLIWAVMTERKNISHSTFVFLYSSLLMMFTFLMVSLIVVSFVSPRVEPVDNTSPVQFNVPVTSGVMP
jgi:hypothetical protein